MGWCGIWKCSAWGRPDETSREKGKANFRLELCLFRSLCLTGIRVQDIELSNGRVGRTVRGIVTSRAADVKNGSGFGSGDDGSTAVCQALQPVIHSAHAHKLGSWFVRVEQQKNGQDG